MPLCPDIRLTRHHRHETSIAAPELPLVRRNIELVKDGLGRLQDDVRNDLRDLVLSPPMLRTALLFGFICMDIKKP